MKLKQHKKIIALFIVMFIFYTIINGTFSIYREIQGDTIDLNILDSSGTVTVNFNASGGTLANPNDATRTVQSGSAVGTLPVATNTNYNFDGWFTEPTSGTRISEETIVTGTTVTYYAHWTKIVCKKASSLHTEECATGGACIDNGYSIGDIIRYGTIPDNNNPQSGYAYDCDVNDDDVWDPATERFYYVRSYGGTHQVENSVLVHFTSFDETGQMDDSDQREIYVYDSALDYLPTSSTWDNPSLIEMDGEVTRFSSRDDIEAACGDKTGGNYFATCRFFLENTRFQSGTKGRSGLWLLKENTTLYRIHTGQLSIVTAANDSKNAARPAIEIPSKTIEGFITPQYYTISFNPGDGTLDNPNDATREVSMGTAIGTLPTATKEHYSLIGWFTDPTNGTQINENTLASGNDTYYAHWVESITITLNANGGTVTPAYKEIMPGGAIGELPTPTYAGHEFAGWYTESTDGTQINPTTTFNTSTQIYAHWNKLPLEYVFYIPGECNFTSTGIINGANGNCISTVNPTGSSIDYTQGALSTKKYIDTQVALYDSTNHDKDYEIHFEIASYDYTQNDKQATFFNTKQEATGYPGLVVRKSNDNKAKVEFASRKTSGANVSIIFDDTDFTKMTVYRINGEIFYSINDGERIFANDLTEYNPVFNLTTWFGGAPTNSSATVARRFLIGTLKNMYIKITPDVSNTATITFNPNYQGAQTFDEDYTKGQPIGELPTTTRSGYTFLGWFTDPTNGTQISTSTLVDDDITYYAHWLENITVTFNPGQGTVSPTTRTFAPNTAIGELPIPERTGYTFLGWFTDPTTGTEVTSETVFASSDTIYAHWLENITITFNPGQGTVTPTTRTFAPNTAIGELPIPERTGYTFLGWFTDPTDGTEVTSETVFASSDTIYAHWLENITVTFNANEGTVTPISKTFTPGTAIGELPTPYRVGYDFTGWYTDNTYETEVTSETIFNTSTTIIAGWEESQDITVTFDADGGTTTPSSKTFRPGTAIGELPIPEKTDFLFVGWFTDNTYETEVTEETTFDSTTTIIAKWVDETYVACINSTCYTTLAAAVNAVPKTSVQTTIKVIQDISLTDKVTIQNTQNIDFNCQNFTITSDTKGIFLNKGTLLLKNGTFVSNGTESNKAHVVNNDTGAILNITGGNMTTTLTNVLINAGTINITGGELTATGQSAVINNNDGGVLYVSGGRLIGTSTTKNQAIYNNGGTTTISGTAYLENNSQTGSKYGRACVHNFAGTVNILGGTIISKKNSAVKNSGTMTIGTDDGTIDITNPMMQGNNYGLEIDTNKTVTVYDGIFKGKGASKAINTEASVIKGNATIIHDTETIGGSSYDVAYLEDQTVNYTVTFDKNGGDTVSINTRTYTSVEPIGDLPTASKTNSEFLGWFTSSTGGEKVLTSTEVNGNITYYAHYTNSATVCRPATTLHSYNGTDFGQIHSGTSLTSGDAFDCDVNGDGTYDATTERFYYLTDTSNGKAVFIYSNNTHQNQNSLTPMCKADAVSYGQTFTAGPTTAMEELPTTSDWSNVSLYTEPRTITNESGTTILSNYNYSGKAARLANLDEIKAATNANLNETANELASYTFLLENTASFGDCRSNYWLETTNSNGGAVRIDGTSTAKRLGHATGSSAVRPVIEVPYSSIEGVANIVEFDTIPTAMRTYFNNVSTWNSGQNDSNYTSFNNAMITNLNNYDCAYYTNDKVNTQYGSVFCDQPNKYDTGTTGNINVYEYNETTGTRSNNIANYVFNDNGKLYNFVPGKTYYWESATDSTKKGYVRPTGERRLITIPGTTRQTRNVRDLGGLPVDTNNDGVIDGKVKYQKLYRGEKIWGTNRNGVTRAQLEKLGIYNELDLRASTENVPSEEDQLSNYISNEIIHYKIDHTEFGSPATESKFNGKSYYQLSRDAAINVMQRIVAGDDDYALYFHCRIGADRTGTLAYLLEGVLGVPTEYRHQDYELTTFFGLRERTRYYFKKDSTNDEYKFIYLKKAIRHATPNNDEITGEENVMDWFLLEGNTTDECNDITALINQFRTKMIDYN